MFGACQESVVSRELPFIGTLKVSAEQSRGSLEVIEGHGRTAPPPHVHHERDEFFCVLEGRLTFTLGTDEFEVGPGGTVFVPRGTSHCFKPEPGLRYLLIITPAGLEGFFTELGEGIAAGRSSEAIRVALAGKYDSNPTDIQ
jgi:mannose-6-phosphate isomerase-like protein (cupin superfamily)